MKKLLLFIAFCTFAIQGYSQKLDLGTYTDYSNSSTGSSQSAIPASNGNGRVGWFIQNVSGDGSVMYINFTTAASTNDGSLKLADGSSITSLNFCTLELINIYCASSGKSFIAKEFIGK